jgi:uncharacterized protein YqeY
MLKERIAEDLKTAMRNQNEVRRRTLRSLRAALREKELDEHQEGEPEGEPSAVLTEQQERTVLQKQAKQRRESLQQYEEAGRDDLAEKERAELAVIETYLPERLSDEELERELHEIIERTGATSQNDMGQVMGEAMERLRGRVQGRRVQQRVQEMLGG